MVSPKRLENLRAYVESADNALLVAAKYGVLDGTPSAHGLAHHVRRDVRTPEMAEQELRWRNSAARQIGREERIMQYYMDHKSEGRVTYSRPRERGDSGMFARM